LFLISFLFLFPNPVLLHNQRWVYFLRKLPKNNILFHNEGGQIFYLKFPARIFKIFVPHSHQKGKRVKKCDFRAAPQKLQFSRKDHTDIQSLTPTGVE